MESKHQHFSSFQSSYKTFYEMTDEDIDRLHRVLLDMYKDINAVCKRNNIGLIAAGGTQLGAIRHHGFIPWDDDMDIFIFRSDFERFKDVFISELSDK